jgi:hypothetical protein
MPCPICGADRLIPLSFPDDGEEVVPGTAGTPTEHPVLKCVACGNRLYPNDVPASSDTAS